MKIVRTIAEMKAIGGGDLGFVPTMGAFHKGHLSLMRDAKAAHSSVCVSLFVNPLQFGANEDFSSYPRQEERDFDLAASQGVDIMFAPTRSEMFSGESTTVHVPELTESWEGKVRPGHFDGVTTVVAKLFNIVRPKEAYLGWKDLQQCVVIKRMVDDLGYAVGLSFADTVREEDGLACSSRNAYLTPEQRKLAPALYEKLSELADRFQKEKLPAESIELGLAGAREDLVEQGFELDYLQMVRLSDLRAVRADAEAAIIVAARLGTTRLIDNCRLRLP